MRRNIGVDEKANIEQARKKIKIEQQYDEFQHAAKMLPSNVSDSAHIGHLRILISACDTDPRVVGLRYGPVDDLLPIAAERAPMYP